jgi:hypothetical protein
MQLRSWPLIDALADSQSVLLAGAGGGFDVYSGLPLYFALRQLGKNVHLANLSFASLPEAETLRVSPKCVRVTADTPYSQTYFPEYQLALWFRQRHQLELPVYCFPQTGVVPLLAAYQRLYEILALDAVVLVDGGTDSLMRGDEAGLGTPAEDVTSMLFEDEFDGTLSPEWRAVGLTKDDYRIRDRHLRATRKTNGKDSKRLAKRLRELDTEIANLVKAIRLATDVPELVQELKDAKAERARLAAEATRTTCGSQNSDLDAEVKTIAKDVWRLCDVFDIADPAELREVIWSAVKRIDCKWESYKTRGGKSRHRLAKGKIVLKDSPLFHRSGTHR